MRPLRVAMLMYLGSAWQRGLIGIGVLVLLGERILREGILCPPCRHAFFAWIPLQFTAIGCLAAGGFLGAWQFRRIWSLRTVWLIPRARLQLLGALLCAQVTFAVLVAALNGLAYAGLPLLHASWGGVRDTVEFGFALAMLYAIGTIVLLGPSRLANIAVICAIGAAGLNPAFLMRSEIAGMRAADALLLAALAALALFGIWFLRTGPVSAPFVNWADNWSSSRVGRLLGFAGPGKDGGRNRPLLARSAAIEAYLLGSESMLRACQSLLIGCAIYNLTLILTQTATARVTRHPDYDIAPLMLMLFAGLIVNLISGQIARGSRSLWLSGGCSRAQLFATAEKLARRCLFTIGLPLYVIAALEWRFLPTIMQGVSYMTAVSGGAAVCGLYLGLLNFKRRLDPAFLALYLTIIPAVLFPNYISKGPHMPLVWWGVPIMFGCAALALRFAAMRRWLRIDWWRNKPERLPSWALRARGS